MNRPVARRRLLTGATAFALSAPAVSGTAVSGTAWAAPSSLPAQPTLLVAGPAHSRIDRWAALIAPPLAQSMMRADTLHCDNVGGLDGVTGVNQFQARINPDGATALLLPGAALLAWLVGDARVRFDAGSWAPLWGGSSSAMVASRVPLVAGQRPRIAVGSVVGPELEALLALHMMGIDAVPVPESADWLQQRDVDLVYLRGAPVPERLAAGGWRPAFALRSPDASGLMPAHELFIPSRAADPVSTAMFRAVCAAASLEVALVLPAVAPATVVAWWRRGCEQLDDEPTVRDIAASTGVQQDDAGAIAAQLGFIALDTPAMLALRTLLAERYDWRPG